MASSQKLAQRPCSKSASSLSTSVVLASGTSIDLNNINIKSQEITLTQQPHEILSLDYLKKLDSSNKCNHCSRVYSRTLQPFSPYCAYCNTAVSNAVCNLTLTFQNYLHEMSQAYSYEIELKALIQDENKFCRHVVLLTYERMRTDNKIHFCDKSLCSKDASSAHPVIHICASIKRFNKNGSISELQYPLDCSVGAMLLEENFYSDVLLIVSHKPICAHKHVLSAKSNVFKAMFTYEMKENKNGIVIIKEFDPEVIGEMLFFMYTNQTKNLSKFPREVFAAAHKYEINDLKSKCEEHFVFDLNFENAIDILDLATLYDLKVLKKNVKTFMKKYEHELVKEESFLEYLSRDLAINTVADTLKLCDEYNLTSVKLVASEFAKQHYNELSVNQKFLSLFESHPLLMREIYVLYAKK